MQTTKETEEEGVDRPVEGAGMAAKRFDKHALVHLVRRNQRQCRPAIHIAIVLVWRHVVTIQLLPRHSMKIVDKEMGNFCLDQRHRIQSHRVNMV